MREQLKVDPGAEASTLIGRVTVMEEKKREGQGGKEGPGCTAPSELRQPGQSGQQASLDAKPHMEGGEYPGRAVKASAPMTPASNATLPPLLVSPAWTTLQGPSPSSSACHASSASRVGSAGGPPPPVPLFPLSPTSTHPLGPSPPLGASLAPLLPTPTPSASLATTLDAPVPFPGFSPGPSPMGPLQNARAEAQGASGVSHALFFSVRSPSAQAPPNGVSMSPSAPAAGETRPETGAGAGAVTGSDIRTEGPTPVPHLPVPEAGPTSAQAADGSPGMPALEGRFTLMDKIIGEGKFGTVRPALDRATGEVLACKRLGKREMARAGAGELLQREVAAMETLQLAGGHRNIVQLRAKFEDEDSVCLIMDLCEEGELYEELVRRGGGSKAPFTSSEAGRAFFQIVSGVAFCHANGVVHRDLKPENILLTRSKTNASPFPALPCSPLPNKGGASPAPPSPFSRALAAFAGVVPASPGAPSPARALPFPSPRAVQHTAPIPMPGSASSMLEHAASCVSHGTPPPASASASVSDPARSPKPCPPQAAAPDASMGVFPNSPDADMVPAKEDSAVGAGGSRGSAPGLPREGPRSPAASGIPVPVPVPAGARSARGSPGSKGARGSPESTAVRISPGKPTAARSSLCARNNGFRNPSFVQVRAPLPVFGRRARRAPASVPAKLCPIYEGGEEEGEGGEELLRRQAGRGGSWANPWGRLGQRSSTATKRDREDGRDTAQSPGGSDLGGAEGGGVGAEGACSEGGADGNGGRSVRRCLRMNGAPGSAPRPTRGSLSPGGAGPSTSSGRNSLAAASAAGAAGAADGGKEGKSGAVGLSREGLSPAGAPSDGPRAGAGPRQVKRCLLPSPGEEGLEGAGWVDTRSKRRLLQKASPRKDVAGVGQEKKGAMEGGANPDSNTASGAKDVSMDSTPAVHQPKESSQSASAPTAADAHPGQQLDKEQRPKEHQQQQEQQQQGGGVATGEHILKIADFGLAVVLEPQETAKGVAGSPMYMAPEACAGSFNAKADVWSLGVILYILLCGSHPFPDLARAERDRKARRVQLQKEQHGVGAGGKEGGREGGGGGGDVEEVGREGELRRGVEALKLDENGYPVLSWPRRDAHGTPGASGEACGASPGPQGAPRDPIPEAAKGLVRSLLHSNPARRPTARKVLTHPWLLQCVYGGSVVRRKGLSPLAQKSPVKGALPKPVAAKTALTPLRAPPNVGATVGPMLSGPGVGMGGSPWSPASPGAAAGTAEGTPVRQALSAGRELFPPPSPWSPAALGLGPRHGFTPGGVPGSPAAGARHGEGSGAPLAQPSPGRSGAHPQRSQVVLIPISPFPQSPLSKGSHRGTPRPPTLPAGVGTGAGGVRVGPAPVSANKPPPSPLRPASSQAGGSGAPAGASSPWKPLSRGTLGPSRMSQQGPSQ